MDLPSFDRNRIIPPPALDMPNWHLPFPLRDYQKEGVDALLAEHRGTLNLPTGAGKTLTAIETILRVRQPTVIVLPTKALIDTTWIPALQRAGIQPGVYFGEEKKPGFVTLATYQTLMRNPEVIRSFPVIIFDEGDLSVGPVWRRILEEARSHDYAAVLTATLPTEKERREELLKEFPILIKRTPREMIEAGHFVPVQVVPKFITLSAGAQRQYDEIEQRIRRLRAILRTGNPQRIRTMLTSPSVSLETRRAAGLYLRLIQERTSLLANVPERAPVALDIARAHPLERIIMFGTRVEPLSEVCAYLTMSGTPCRLISGQTGREDRRDIFRHWGLDVSVVASVDVLTRGIDVPEASVAILMGGGAGERRLIQRVGRIVRPAPGKSVATVYVVVSKGTTEERLLEKARRIFAGGKFIEETEEDGDDSDDNGSE